MTSKKKNDLLTPDNPRTIITAGMVVIFLFFGVLGTWAAVFKLAGAVIASGEVRASTNRKAVQHLEGGIVKEILVQDGSRVHKGDVLIRLQGEQTRASVDLLRGQLDVHLAAEARLEAERALANEVHWPEELTSRSANPDVAAILTAEDKLFQTRRTTLESQIALIKAQIEQINEQIQGYNEQLRSTEAIIRSLEEELHAKRTLLEGRYIEKSRILELERMLASHQGRRGEILSALGQLREKSAELTLRISSMKDEFVQQATAQLTDTKARILELRERLRPLEDALARLDITAPMDGTVVNLAVHSVEGVIRPGETLMEIVPENEPLILDCKIPTQDITHVYVGQPAEVQLVAFKARTTPMIPGKVIYVSADRVLTRTPHGDMPTYVVHVEVDRAELEKHNLYLSPGMPVAAFLTTKERTILAYFTDPLLEYLRHAMREN